MRELLVLQREHVELIRTSGLRIEGMSARTEFAISR